MSKKHNPALSDFQKNLTVPSMSTITLRPYQAEAVQAVFDYWARGGGNPVVEVPTGGGKSAILGEIARRLVSEHSATVLVCAHRKELLVQDEAAIRRVWPGAKVGVYSAGLNRYETSQITVAGIQSIGRKPKLLGRVDVVIIDEAHLVPDKGNGQYRKLLEHLRFANAELRVVGLTATPYRLGQGVLTAGANKLFDSIVYRISIKRLIDEGYLSPLVSARASVAIDTGEVRIDRGDFVARELELAANVSEITDAVVRDVAETKRQHVIVFGVGVEHAAFLRNGFRFAGFSAETVTGDTPPAERARILEAFKAGRLQVLCSCDVLTTGFDAPLVDCLAVVRPTMSPGLFVQMVGRGARLAPGKTNCIVLDYGGNLARHGAIDQIEPKIKNADGVGAPVAYCPVCLGEMPSIRRTCPHCGHVRPPPSRQERKANQRPSSLAVVAGTKKQKILAVTERIVLDYVSQSSGARMLRVDYYGEESSTRQIASEYVCLEHEGYARMKAEAWWMQMTGRTEVPEHVEQAMDWIDWLRPVKAIRVEPDGKFQRVVGYIFTNREPGDDGDTGTTEKEAHPDEELPF